MSYVDRLIRDNLLYHPTYDFDLSAAPLPSGVHIERRSGNAWALDTSGAPVEEADENEPVISHYWTGSAWASSGVQVRPAATAMLRDSGSTTNWGADTGQGGITFTKSNVTIGGLPCVRIRFHGTASSTTTRRVYLESYSGTPLVGYLTDFIKGDLATLVGHFALSAGSLTNVSALSLVMREYYTVAGVQQSPDISSIAFTPTAATPAKATAVKLPHRVRRAPTLFNTLLPVIQFSVTSGLAIDFTLDLHVQLLKNSGVAEADEVPFPTSGTDKLARDVEILTLDVRAGRYDVLVEDHVSQVFRTGVETTGSLTIVPPAGGQSVKRVQLYRRGSILRSQRRRLAPDALPAPLWTFKPTLANTTVDESDGVSAIDMGGGRTASQSNSAKRPVRIVDGSLVYLDFQEGNFLDLTGFESPNLRTLVVTFKAPDLEVPHVDGSTIQCTILGQEGVANRQQLCIGGPTVAGSAVYANAIWTLHNQNATALDADAVSQTVPDFDPWTVVAHTRDRSGLYQPFDIYQPSRDLKMFNSTGQFERYIVFADGYFAEIGRRYDPDTTVENPAQFVGQIAEIRCYSPPLNEAQRARVVEEMASPLPTSTLGLSIESLWLGAITDTGATAVVNVTGAEVGQRARLIVSTNEDLSSPVYTSSYVVASDRFTEVSPALSVFKIAVPPATLTAGTVYYANVEFE